MMKAPTYSLRTAGQLVAVDSDLPAGTGRLVAATGQAGRTGAQVDYPDVHVRIEGTHRPFSRSGMTPVARGAWTDGNGHVLLENAGGSGHSQLWSVGHITVETRSRWRPTPAQAAAAFVLRSRQRVLEAQVLLHYPALWSAARHGLAPLHISVLRDRHGVVALAGPGGLGKSTLVAAEIARGAVVLCDNIAVSDGISAFGLAEPMRLDPSIPFHSPGPISGARHATRTTHRRREHPWGARPDDMTPDLLVVVRRGRGDSHRVREISSDEAAAALIAGTFAAGELGRFWALSATLALATSFPDVLPPVAETAHELAGQLPCVALELGRPGVPLRSMLSHRPGNLHHRSAS